MVSGVELQPTPLKPSITVISRKSSRAFMSRFCYFFTSKLIPLLPHISGGHDPSIINRNSKKNLYFYCFVTFYKFLSFKNDVNVRYHFKKYCNKQKTGIQFFLVGVLKVTDEKSRIWVRYLEVRIRGSKSVRYQNVTDPEHCFSVS